VFAAIFYLLMCDGFPGGRSLGKWLTGLKVVRIDRDGMDFTASLMRNLPVARRAFLRLPLSRDRPFLAYTSGSAIAADRDVPRFYDPDGQRGATPSPRRSSWRSTGRGSDGVPLI